MDKSELTQKSSRFLGLLSGQWIDILVWISRFFIGGIFVFSGFVKAIDPWGTVYKFEEYFQALHIPQMANIAVPLSFLLFTLEFIIGIFIFTGCYRRLAVWGAALFMLVMLPLTFWIYVADPVEDCGCFGDAFQISNFATFIKNLILSILIIWLLFFNRRCRCLVTPALQWISFSLSVIFIVLIGWIGYYYQPLIDFRPYRVGSSLNNNPSDAETEENLEPMVGIYERDGKQIRIPLDSIPDDSWNFVGREITGNTSSKDESHAALFDLEDDEDVTTEILSGNEDKLLLFFNSIGNVSTANFYRINSLYDYCQSHGVQMIGIAAGEKERIENFKDLSLAEYPIYMADESWIKEVVRGNPGVVLLRNGKIIWKSTLNSMTPDDFMSGSVPSDPAEFARDNNFILFTLVWVYLGLMALLIILSFVPKVIHHLNKRKYNRFIKGPQILLIALSALLAVSCTNDDLPIPEKGEKESATLIYMIANNSLLSDSNNDIREIMQGCENIDLKKNPVMLYIASPYYDLGLYKIEKGNDGKSVLKMVKQYDENVSSLEKNRITNVINDFLEYNKSESYGLILWSHATGWIPSNDTSSKAIRRTFGDDNGIKINIEELADAIPDGSFRYIWFDCCLMGGIECCYQLREKASYIISSPTEIMSYGAPYEIILPIIAKKNGNLVEAAQKEFEYYRRLFNSLGFTISIVDCSQLNSLALECEAIVAPYYPDISTASLQTYGTQAGKFNDGSKYTVTYYDFGQVFRKYAEMRGIDSEPFTSCLNRTVIYKASTPKFRNIVIQPENYSGLSVYVPLSPEAIGYNEELQNYYLGLDWAKAITNGN